MDHLVTMVFAVVVLHLTAASQRRRPRPAGFGLPLMGVAATLALIVLGIHLLGRAIV